MTDESETNDQNFALPSELQDIVDQIKTFKQSKLQVSKRLAKDTSEFLAGILDIFDGLDETTFEHVADSISDLEEQLEEAKKERDLNKERIEDVICLLDRILSETPDARLRARLEHLIENLKERDELDRVELELRTFSADRR